MQNPEFVNVNGKILLIEEAAISIDDGAFRSGTGLIETMKMENGKIFLEAYHMERLFESVKTLRFNHHSIMIKERSFKADAIELAEKNDCIEKAKVRITISPGNGLVYEKEDGLNYTVECSPLKDEPVKELTLDIFPDARKSCDIFSNLKTTSRLPYMMASRFAKENGFDDCLLLNTHDRICDSTISNIFWIKNKKIFTPPLTEGCVAGVMRRWIMEKTQGTRNEVQERTCEIADLENADEIFLTNAVRGIRPVKKFRNAILNHQITGRLSKSLKF